MTEKEIQLPLSALRASIWKHFGFYKVELKDFGNKSNMRNLITHFQGRMKNTF